jgi:octaprenyl-diphosphate synthase
MSLAPLVSPRDSLADLYAPIVDDLRQVDRILHQELQSDVPFIAELTNRVRNYQGKRIRPAMMLLTARALGQVTPDHYVLAAVLEMIHTATLVHDDLLDDASTRRHVTTIHAEWGTEAAVLLGDFLFSRAYHLAATLDSTEGCRVIGTATNQTCEGELRQISHRGTFDLPVEEYIEILAGKTAELISCACRLGASFAHANASTIDAMARFGRNVGIAFQIADDVLDLVGEPRNTGKSTGTDWAKRKITLPLIRFRDTADIDRRERARLIFDDPAQNGRELLDWVRASDAIDFSFTVAKRYVENAVKELEVLPAGMCRDRLHQIASFASRREF